MVFRCRQDELRKMERRYDAGEWECIVIYGRRRVGKTALINEFCKNRKTIYFSALNASPQENLRALSKAIWQSRYPEDENYPVYPDYESALAEIGKRGAAERIIFVIDEYPYLAKAVPSISSRLQHRIDHGWQESKLYLILCGSSMSFMQNQVLGYESPLYGRRTAQFKIEPLDYKETAEFHPNLSHEENAWVYGITGGIPHYINKLGIRDSLDEAVVDSVFDRSGYLFEEPDNLLKQELREPGVYNSIITAVAEGASKLNEIATKVGMESGPCAKYMKTLIELGILKKETPVTEKPGKKTIYSIEDNFFRFWYRFVPQNYSLIASGKFPGSYGRAVKSRMHDFMGLIFEKMCREYLLRYADDLPFTIAEIGQWWGNDPVEKKQIQIDIVAVPVKGAERHGAEYLIGSCKFRNEKTGTDELELLEHDAAVFAQGAKVHLIIFSLSGFTDELKKAASKGNVRLVTLDDMYC